MDNGSPAVPSSDEVRGRGLASRFSGLQDAPSACQQVQRVLPLQGVCLDVGALELFRGERNRQFTGDEVFFYDHLCHASLPREHKSAEVWTWLAEWIWALAAVATLYPEEMKNNHSRIRRAAATFPRHQWQVNNARLRSTVAGQQAVLMGTGTCGKEALHAELQGVFRQGFCVTVPAFRLKLDLFKLSKQEKFDGARRIPMLRQMS